MIYDKGYIYNLAQVLDAKSCKLFLMMWGKSDSEGNVQDTSLSIMSDKTGMAITTVRRAIDSLQKAGILQVRHEVGVKTYYKLLQPDNFSSNDAENK